MSPYRSMPLVEPAAIAPRSLWRRLRRKFVVWLRGSYRKRFPAKCPVCGIASWDPRDTVNWNEYGGGKTKDICLYRCGHELPELTRERNLLYGRTPS